MQHSLQSPTQKQQLFVFTSGDSALTGFLWVVGVLIQSIHLNNPKTQLGILIVNVSSFDFFRCFVLPLKRKDIRRVCPRTSMENRPGLSTWHRTWNRAFPQRTWRYQYSSKGREWRVHDWSLNVLDLTRWNPSNHPSQLNIGFSAHQLALPFLHRKLLKNRYKGFWEAYDIFRGGYT